jgi:hypothetical protein
VSDKISVPVSKGCAKPVQRDSQLANGFEALRGNGIPRLHARDLPIRVHVLHEIALSPGPSVKMKGTFQTKFISNSL